MKSSLRFMACQALTNCCPPRREYRSSHPCHCASAVYDAVPCDDAAAQSSSEVSLAEAGAHRQCDFLHRLLDGMPSDDAAQDDLMQWNYGEEVAEPQHMQQEHHQQRQQRQGRCAWLGQRGTEWGGEPMEDDNQDDGHLDAGQRTTALTPEGQPTTSDHRVPSNGHMHGNRKDWLAVISEVN